jgi:hypothetical protein
MMMVVEMVIKVTMVMMIIIMMVVMTAVEKVVVGMTVIMLMVVVMMMQVIMGMTMVMINYDDDNGPPYRLSCREDASAQT